MKTNNIIPALIIGTMTFTSCCHDDDDSNNSVVQQTAVNTEAMYQVATLQSLMTGNYDGFISVGEFRKYGNIGLGTFDAVDGEMIVLDGTVYQARHDGSVRIADDTTGIPFATVTTFDADVTLQIDKIESMDQLTKQLTATVEKEGKNLIYAVRIDVNDCEDVLVRSELPQAKPYRPLAEALATDQREYRYQDISGTIVAIYFPSFFTSQNTPGWHCHFISADRTKGGHMLNIQTSTPAQAQFDATSYFDMYLPSASAFANSNLDKDMSKDIEKVEK